MSHLLNVCWLVVVDIVLKDASKVFSNKLSCGASITKTPTGKKQIDVQGDFVDEVYELIRTKYPEVRTSLPAFRKTASDHILRA